VPHMPLAVLIPLIVQSIQALAPLIQEMFSSSDDSGEKYSNGKISLKEYTDQLNTRLERLRDQAKAQNISLPIGFNKVNSAIEVENLAVELQAVVDKIDGGKELQEIKGLRQEIVNEITALKKASVEFRSEGVIIDPDKVNDFPSFPSPTPGGIKTGYGAYGA
jgi:hypothetical protein